jgi:5-methylcytosine-specific restriction endonuclease McrA
MPFRSKVCTHCKTRRSISHFPRRESNPDGKDGNCKICHRTRSSAWYTRVRNSVAFRLSNCTKAVRWQQQNPEKRREITRRYYAKHRTKCRSRVERWRRQHFQEWKAWCYKHVRTPQFRMADNIREHNRRTRIRGNGGILTPNDWALIVSRQDGRCNSCHKKVDLAIDHVIPVCRGGSSDPSNIQGLCKPCNSKKGGK